MRPEIVKTASRDESLTRERCFIRENWNNSGDGSVSIARARVEPGVTTVLHYLDGVDERYIIASGRGLVELADLPQTEVTEGDVVIIPAGARQRITNIGDSDLIFYCICTPPYTPGCYKEVEED